MEKRKHILSMLLFVASCLFSTNAIAYDALIDGIYYNLIESEGQAEVTSGYSGYFGCYLGTVTIPETVSHNGETYFVTSIGSRAFLDCPGLTSVSIPNSVTSIGEKAFCDCSGLTSITIPNSVTSIEGGAFDSCTGLKKVIVTDIAAWCGIAFDGYLATPLYYAKHLYSDETTEITNLIIPNSVTSIGGYAFYGCSNLTSVTIPNSVTSIGNSAFYHCYGLTSITIPNSVTSIGGRAFDGCSGLTSVTIPNSVTSIGGCAFQCCSGLTSVTIPNSVTSIGGCAFNGCSGLTSVTIGNSVTNIEYNAFSWCERLTSVTIPNSVTSIGECAFKGCTGLTSLIIPKSVTSIGGNGSPFEGCTGLTSIEVESGNRTYDSRNNCNAIIETATNKLIQGCENTIIPSSVTSIGWAAFIRCSGLTSVTIPNSVTSIGPYAFEGCSGLTSIEVESGNRTYDSRNNCNAIIETATNTLIQGCKNTTIPNSVTSIGYSAFFNCSGLTSVTIPNSVSSIGYSAFEGCSGLTSIEVESGNRTYDSRNNCNAIIETATNTLIQGCKNTTIPNSVTSIGNFAFSGCSGLTSVTIPNFVTSIGDYAFYGCPGLTSVSIGNSVTSIGYDAFRNCSGLTSVTIPNSVTSIGSSAFRECSGLTSVTIGNSVTSIGSSAFQGCSGLTSVNIGNGVWNIWDEAFAYCKELTDVYCYAETVPSTKSNAFDGSYTEYATLHVPAVFIEWYKAEAPWCNFGAIVPLTDEDAIAEVQAVPVLIQTQGNTIIVEGAEAGTEIILYGINGVQLDSVIATTGTASLNASRLSGSVAIVKIGNKTVKVLVKQ